MKLERNGRLNMELDDFKKSNLNRDGNEIERSLNHDSRTDQFLELFKTEIKNQRKKSLIWISFLLMLSVIYISVSVRMDSLTSTGYHLCVIGFTLGAIYLYFRSRPLPNSTYTLPLLDFMDKAKQKINYMNLTDWLIVVPLLLILGTGGGIILVNRLLHYTPNTILLIIIWILFFISLCIFGFVVSKKKWKKEQQSLLEEFQKVRESLAEKIN